jgi:hypothetical protein
LPFTWVDLCTEGILLPEHAAHSFIRSLLDPSTPPLTFDPVASIVSAVNLHRDCPPSLLQASELLRREGRYRRHGHVSEDNSGRIQGTP